MTYQPKTFAIKDLVGISAKSIEEHIGLYQGYVKNFNAITASIEEMLADPEKNVHQIAELTRRRSFEFGGMRLHELYFPQLSGGVSALNEKGALGIALAAQYGSVEAALMQLRRVSMMRGPGWAILYYDKDAATFHIGFTGEQHQGHFVALPIILALDVWEHAYILDYGAGGRGAYVDAFFANCSWTVAEERFSVVA